MNSNYTGLWSAVIKQALIDLIPAYEQGKLDWRKVLAAKAWLTSEVTTPQSFNWVCQQLDICPRRIRSLIGSYEGLLHVLKCTDEKKQIRSRLEQFNAANPSHQFVLQ